jgi:hypothetical protein
MIKKLFLFVAGELQDNPTMRDAIIYETAKKHSNKTQDL